MELSGLLTSRVPQQIFTHYEKLKTDYDGWKKWNYMTEEELWHRFCLCVLSSNVPYELAVSAFNRLLKLGVININWIISRGDSQKIIATFLSQPKYLPLKRDGSFRKYRFPNMRAKNIVNSAFFLTDNNMGFKFILNNNDSDSSVREILVNSFHGFGLKQATHFLRDIGYTKNLAIVDTHIISFLNIIFEYNPSLEKKLTPNKYLKIEKLFQNVACELGLELAIFDMAVWHYMRQEGKLVK